MGRKSLHPSAEEVAAFILGLPFVSVPSLSLLLTGPHHNPHLSAPRRGGPRGAEIPPSPL